MEKKFPEIDFRKFLGNFKSENVVLSNNIQKKLWWFWLKRPRRFQKWYQILRFKEKQNLNFEFSWNQAQAHSLSKFNKNEINRSGQSSKNKNMKILNSHYVYIWVIGFCIFISYIVWQNHRTDIFVSECFPYLSVHSSKHELKKWLPNNTKITLKKNNLEITLKRVITLKTWRFSMMNCRFNTNRTFSKVFSENFKS